MIVGFGGMVMIGLVTWWMLRFGDMVMVAVVSGI